MPILVGDVPVDPLSIGADERHLVASVEVATRSDGIPILPLPALVYLKLKSPRRRDAADVVDLLRVAADPASVRSYLATHAPDLLARYDALAREAED